MESGMVNTVKTLTFEKRWGVHNPLSPSSYGGAAPAFKVT